MTRELRYRWSWFNYDPCRRYAALHIGSTLIDQANQCSTYSAIVEQNHPPPGHLP